MSDNEKGDSGDEAPITEADLARDIEDKCYKAFLTFDTEGNGGEIKSDQVA